MNLTDEAEAEVKKMEAREIVEAGRRRVALDMTPEIIVHSEVEAVQAWKEGDDRLLRARTGIFRRTRDLVVGMAVALYEKTFSDDGGLFFAEKPKPEAPKPEASKPEAPTPKSRWRGGPGM